MKANKGVYGTTTFQSTPHDLSFLQQRAFADIQSITLVENFTSFYTGN